MKRTLGFLFLVILFATAACIRYVPYGESGRYPGDYPYDRDYDRDYDRYDNYDNAYFYNELEPYGLWVTFRPYGYVWVPRYVGYNWRPYSQGHWVWTDYGWTWVSVERWGWIAFHYGRWGWDRRLGWFWVPDTVWGPGLGRLALGRRAHRLGAPAAGRRFRPGTRLRPAPVGHPARSLELRPRPVLPRRKPRPPGPAARAEPDHHQHDDDQRQYRLP